MSREQLWSVPSEAFRGRWGGMKKACQGRSEVWEVGCKGGRGSSVQTRIAADTGFLPLVHTHRHMYTHVHTFRHIERYMSI